MRRPIAIVGAGIAGLSCALHLHRHGVGVRVFEAGKAVGGRVRTDQRDGFLLDRGFQCLWTSFPEVERMLDFELLELQRLARGVLVPVDGAIHSFPAPAHGPLQLLSVLRSPIAALPDRLRLLRLQFSLGRGAHHRLLRREETTTLERLQTLGFTSQFIDRYFRPLLAGWFLEADLETSSRWFELLFRHLGEGDAALPAGGMQQIPEHLAAQLPHGCVHLEAPAREVGERSITLESGDTVLCGGTVVATSEPVAAQLLGSSLPTGRQGHSVCSLWFDAPSPPVQSSQRVLGNPGGVITALCVPSLAAKTYAPPGRHLVSVTVLPARAASLQTGHPKDQRTESVEAACRRELNGWFGAEVDRWQLLEQQTIDYALPPQRRGGLLNNPPPTHGGGIFCCGDYLETSTIQGALVSGRKTAEEVRRNLVD